MVTNDKPYPDEYPDEAGYPDGMGFLDEGTKQHAEPTSDYEIEVFKDDTLHKYNAVLGEYDVGSLTYDYVGGRIVLLQTVVINTFRHHGIATELISRVLDDIRSTGRKITIICPIVREFIDLHPEYEGLVDPAHPGVGSS
jgi:predicted GNAT family acetyltransferase